MLSDVEYESDGKLPKSKLCFTGVDVTTGINILSEEGTDDNEIMDGSSWLKDSSDKLIPDVKHEVTYKGKK